MFEYFKTYNASNVKKTANTIEKLSGFNASVYGTVVIPYRDCKTYEWKFKVKTSYDSIAIGIDEANEKWINKGFFWQKSTNNYAYHSNGDIYKSGSQCTYGDSWAKNPTISMTLNMNTKTLSFKKFNKKYKEIKIKNTRFGYKMCVAMNGKWQTVELLSYSCLSDDDEKSSKKMVETKKKAILELKLNKIINEKVRKISQFETVNASLKTNNTQLTDEIKKLKVNAQMLNSKVERLSNKNDDYKQANLRQRSTVLSLQSQIESLQSQLSQSQNEKKQLQRDNDKLLDDQKELQMTIQDLKKDIKQLKLKNIDTTRYLEWEAEEILAWIMTLENGRYAKYEAILRESLNDEEVKGINLRKVDVSDVKGWGVKKFDDKKDLTQSIQQLVQQNLNVQKNVGLNEGAPTAYI